MFSEPESERDGCQGRIGEARSRKNRGSGDEQSVGAPDFPVRVNHSRLRIGTHPNRSDVMPSLRHECALYGAWQVRIELNRTHARFGHRREQLVRATNPINLTVPHLPLHDEPRHTERIGFIT